MLNFHESSISLHAYAAAHIEAEYLQGYQEQLLSGPHAGPQYFLSDCSTGGLERGHIAVQVNFSTGLTHAEAMVTERLPVMNHKLKLFNFHNGIFYVYCIETASG